MRYQDIPDLFQVRPLAKSLSDAPPLYRQVMLKWARRYTRMCERNDARLPSLREMVNS